MMRSQLNGHDKENNKFPRTEQVFFLKPGSFIESYAFLLLGLVMAVVLGVTMLIRYPEFVKVRVSLGNHSPVKGYNVIADDTLQLSGKVHEGQQVRFYFDGYSYEEYGFVSGIVKKRSANSPPTLCINPDTLITNKKQSIHYYNGIKADAFIVVADMSLLKRVFSAAAHTK